MPLDAFNENEIEKLKAELESVSQKVIRSELIAQNLRDTQHRLDMHLDEFSRIHEYAQKAFSCNDSASLYAIIVEGIVDIVQLEVGAMFEVDITDQKLRLLSSVNLETEETEFPLPQNDWLEHGILEGLAKSNAIYEFPVKTQPWTSLGLASVIFMPFYNSERHLSRLMVGGITKENETIYDFIPKELVSPFMVYCQQMSGILGMFEAVAKANEAGRAKSRFLANLSHEIRTPMNAIIGMVQIAERSRESGEIERCIKQIGISSKHLLGLINDVLDIAKIEDGKLKLARESFVLRETIESIRISLSQLAENKSQNFIVDFHDIDNPTLLGDEMRLSQVLINLLGNALKFTPEKGTIRLDISEFSRDADSLTLHFAVSDTGIGVSQEFRKRLFKPFEQADNSISRDFGGTGLGLAISQHIVELMEGRIKLESEPGNGACFSFSVRFEIDKTDASGSAKDAKIEEDIPDFTGKRIMIVDDVRINRIILRSFLKGTNAIPEEAETGQEALDKYLASPPGYYSLIFMDMQMPVMDGCTATRLIRASDREDAKSLPIIAMTANVFKEDVQEVLEAGMNGHIGKPVDLKLVLETMRKFLEK